MTVTGYNLLQFVELPFARASVLAEYINTIAETYKINTPLRMAAFIAQVVHESDGFKAKVENMNYRAERLMKVWPARFPDQAFADRYAGNPEKLGNYVYANRMGNSFPARGDGYRYRGGGFIQMTGRDMYAKYAKFKGKPIEEVAAAVKTSDLDALDSAAWVFVEEKKLLDEADRGDINTISRRINGGDVGLQERYGIYQKALKVFGAK